MLTFVAYLLYETLLVGLWGRTLGKQVMGLTVVPVGGGHRPGMRRSVLRILIPAAALALLLLYPLPYVLAATAEDHRGFYDRLAGTRVVTRRRRPRRA